LEASALRGGEVKSISYALNQRQIDAMIFQSGSASKLLFVYAASGGHARMAVVHTDELGFARRCAWLETFRNGTSKSVEVDVDVVVVVVVVVVLVVLE
jgi:hypothetical protein